KVPFAIAAHAISLFTLADVPWKPPPVLEIATTLVSFAAMAVFRCTPVAQPLTEPFETLEPVPMTSMPTPGQPEMRCPCMSRLPPLTCTAGLLPGQLGAGFIVASPVIIAPHETCASAGEKPAMLMSSGSARNVAPNHRVTECFMLPSPLLDAHVTGYATGLARAEDTVAPDVAVAIAIVVLQVVAAILERHTLPDGAIGAGHVDAIAGIAQGSVGLEQIARAHYRKAVKGVVVSDAPLHVVAASIDKNPNPS